ncbi:MAG: EamA family transporter [bacterium]
MPRTTFRAYHHRAVRHPISNQILVGNLLAFAGIALLGFAALGFLPIWLIDPAGMWQILSTPWTLFLAILMGLGPSAISSVLYLWRLQRIPPSLASVNCTWEPLLGVTWGALFFGDTLVPLQWLGSLLVVGLVAAVSWQAAQRIDSLTQARGDPYNRRRTGG